jgi:hypothetical protein
MIIYCDLDGVLVDLASKLGQRIGIDLTGVQNFSFHFYKFITSLNSSEKIEFWQTLPKTNDCDNLWNYIKVYNPLILTSCSDSREACIGKKKWCKNNIGIKYSKVICVQKSSHKQNYASKNLILIDDLESNIREWKEAGGIAILHKSADETIEQLKIVKQQIECC